MQEARHITIIRRNAEVRYIALVVGFTLAYTTCVSFFYSSWLIDLPDYSVSGFDNILNPAIFIASLVFSVLAGLVPSVKRLPLLVIGYAAFLCALGCLIIVAATGNPQPVLIALSAATAGVGMGFVMPFYFEAFAGFSARRIALACGCMSLGGMGLSMTLDLLPNLASFAAYALCLAGSAVCFAFGMRQVEGGEDAHVPARAQGNGRKQGSLSRQDFLNVFLVSGVCTLALSVVYGILDTAAMGGSTTPGGSVLISQFGGIVAAIVFLLYFGLRSKHSSSLLINAVCGMLATGILFLPFLPGDYAVALNLFAAAGWKLVMLSLFYLVVTTYAHDRMRLLVGISLAYALPRLGLFIGLNIALVLGIGGTADFVRTTAVAFFLLYLIMMVVWLANAHDRKKAETQAREAGEMLGRFAQEQESVRKLRCDTLADEAGLTNRERDILYLLAQGRDLAFMCDTLCLSKNTVKSYQKTIYLKLDVHSKQEIIDLTQG